MNDDLSQPYEGRAVPTNASGDTAPAPQEPAQEPLSLNKDERIRQLELQLAAAEERARQYKEDTERLDWLEKRRCALNAHYGTHYGWKFVSSRNVNRLFVRDVNTIDLIDAARKESQS